MTTDHNIWPTLSYDNALGAREWLKRLGFTEGICVVADHDPALVEHSEMLWPEGGRVAVSSRARGNEFITDRGTAGVYVVCDDPDAVYARATSLGADLVRDLREEDYGSRGFSVRDAEGTIWSFGTYAG